MDPEAAAKMDEEDEMDIARARITLKHRNKGKVCRPSMPRHTRTHGRWRVIVVVVVVVAVGTGLTPVHGACRALGDGGGCSG